MQLLQEAAAKNRHALAGRAYPTKLSEFTPPSNNALFVSLSQVSNRPQNWLTIGKNEPFVNGSWLEFVENKEVIKLSSW